MGNELSKETRTRNWTIIVYPDSAPSDWRERLDSLHIEWIESPLHDKDLNATGEAKKPHWHILLMFGGVKSYEQVLEVCNSISAPIPERCHNTRAMVRYMAHLDNPDKFRYNVSDIVPHGGVDLSDLLKPTASERDAIIFEIMDFIDDHDIIEFSDLVRYARKNQPLWASIMVNNATYVLGQYIKSCRHKRKSDSGNLD